MGVKNYDLKTVTKVISTVNTGLSLGAVPTGMKRWVTFVRVDNVYGGENKLFLISNTTETAASTITLASARAKDRITLQAKEHFANPPQGPASPDFPLFFIAAAKYLTAKTNRGSVNLFLQYFDGGD
ncbi:MAG: hypothetical protein Q8J68_07930 [Methanolobus sp.]|uniref:hypothetical protein n=1 Tax=Methanolobus sp. TaxID=1874737 RepID=UPI002730BCA1|nr:hypothetical protein [Methanolobus sp.]MDP2217197.1 hypothetical protein [Methanolobus sp.]